MKFVSATIALVAAMAVGSDAKRFKNKQEWKRELSRRMKNGQLNTATLMEGAKPHSEAAKRRALDDSSVTALHSVQFDSCFSLSTSYEELFEDGDDSLISLFAQGEMLASHSYAIFKLCYAGNCDSTSYGYGNGNANGNYGSYNQQVLEYVVDLDTYVQALINYLPAQMESYCEGCQENANACSYMLSNQNQSYNGNGGGRKLAELHEFESRVLNDNGGQVYKQLDCNLCVEYQCFDNNNNENNNNNNNNNPYNFEAASEWLSAISQCADVGISYSPSGYNYNNGGGDGDYSLYAGFICNAAGTGVEIGMFMDEDCHLYLPNEPYANYMGYYDQTYVSMTKEVVEFTFSNAIFECKDEEVVYTVESVNSYGYGNYNGNNGGDGNGDVAEWCAALFDGDSSATDFVSCGGYNSQYNEDGSYNYGAGQNVQEKYDQYYENQDQDQDQYMYTYSWYRYDIDEELAYDNYEVCLAVMKNGGNLKTFYNSQNGNIYSYNNANAASSSISEFMEDTDNDFNFASASWISSAQKLSGGAKFGIIVGTGLAFGAAAPLFLLYRSTTIDAKNVGLMVDEQSELGPESYPKGEAA